MFRPVFFKVHPVISGDGKMEMITPELS